MRIQELYHCHPDAVIYLVGTGPSLRVFPKDFLRGKVTIGLNQAWKHLDTTYSITVHPELLTEYEAQKERKTRWLVKRKPPREDLDFDHPDYFVFHTSANFQTVVTRPDDVLVIGEGVQCTALDLAARMGARTIVMIGCDACSLGGDFHGHKQHVRWLGQRPDAQYALYRKTTAQVRRLLRENFQVNVLTLSPFIGVGHAEEDYQRLRTEHKLQPLPKPQDVSPYSRAGKHPEPQPQPRPVPVPARPITRPPPRPTPVPKPQSPRLPRRKP